MKIELLSRNEQGDYKDSCIQIIPETKSEAYELGQIVSILNIDNYEYVHTCKILKNDKDDVWIRIPLYKRKK